MYIHIYIYIYIHKYIYIYTHTHRHTHTHKHTHTHYIYIYIRTQEFINGRNLFYFEKLFCLLLPSGFEFLIVTMIVGMYMLLLLQ